jgi:hypothetical protein
MLLVAMILTIDTNAIRKYYGQDISYKKSILTVRLSCKQMVKAGKQMTINELPLMCTIHLKRFAFDLERGYMRKITSNVQYPETLDLAPFVSKEKKIEKAEYNLYAVLVHAGYGCDSGHYFAYIKAPNGQWYNADDEYIAPVPVDEVLNQQAYMLFYQQDKPMAKPTLPASPPLVPNINDIAAKKVLVSKKEATEATKQTPATTVTPQPQAPVTTAIPTAAIETNTKNVSTKRRVRFVEPIVKADNPKSWTVQLSTQSHRSLRGNLSPPTYSANVSDKSSWTEQSTSDFIRTQKSKKRRVFRVKLESKKTSWSVNPY